jgi:hypothetical protein
MFKGFSTLSDLFTSGFPVPQSVVNRVLPLAIRDVEEIESLRVEAGEGHFDAVARVAKTVAGKRLTADATVRFRFADVSISLGEQRVTLEQVGGVTLEGQGLAGKIAATVAEAVVLGLLRVDPVRAAAGGMPSVEREGNRYRIDLAPMLPPGWNARLDKPWMKLGKVRAIHPEPGRFRVVLGSTLGL